MMVKAILATGAGAGKIGIGWLKTRLSRIYLLCDYRTLVVHKSFLPSIGIRAGMKICSSPV